jgi:hypothetical protein
LLFNSRKGVAGVVHVFCNDGELVDVIRANGLETVLCVGNDLSFEPHAHGTARSDSDVDLLVQFAPGKKTDQRFVQLCELLEERLGHRVEFLTEEQLSSDETLVAPSCAVSRSLGRRRRKCQTISARSILRWPGSMKTSRWKASSKVDLRVKAKHPSAGGWNPGADR